MCPLCIKKIAEWLAGDLVPIIPLYIVQLEYPLPQLLLSDSSIDLLLTFFLLRHVLQVLLVWWAFLKGYLQVWVLLGE